MSVPSASTNLSSDAPADHPIDGRPVAWAYFTGANSWAIACPLGCGLVHFHTGGDGPRAAHGPHGWEGRKEYHLKAAAGTLRDLAPLHHRAGEIAASLGWPYRAVPEIAR